MNNNIANDTKIMVLRGQIEDKKKQLSKAQKFTPVTNCSIELDTVRSNIQVLTKDQLISLMVKLKSYMMAAEELDVLDSYFISGFKVEEWIADIKSKLEIVCRREEENKLKTMENKLHLLLSNEKKVELEIDEIESMLK